GGLTACRGLFLVGLPWLHTAKSGLIYGVGEDACYVAERIAEREAPRDEAPVTESVPPQPNLPNPRGARHLGNSIQILACVAISAAAFTLTLPSAQGSEAVKQPAPPHTAFLATPASELYLGMPAQDATGVLGSTANETSFVADGTAVRKLEFSRPIRGQVILSDGKVSRVTLEPFLEED